MAVTSARNPAAALVLAAAVAGLVAPAADAQDRGRDKGSSPFRSLGDMLFPDKPEETRRAAPPVARYVSETGETFTLDRSTPLPMLRFEGSNEIWVLAPQPGARGDTLYKTDAGRVMLRDTKVGGLTIFTSRRREGAAAALLGETTPIRLQPVGPKALYQRLYESSSLVSRASRRQVPFEAEASPASSALIADAAMITADTLVRMSTTPQGRERLSRIQRVFLTEGPRPSVTLHDGVLIVIVAPRLGLAGRPSSERVAYATAP